METKRGIATRKELKRLIADRKNDPPTPERNHPTPSWVENTEDPKRVHIRMRERRIRFLTNRLDGVQQKMEREFDRNS